MPGRLHRESVHSCHSWGLRFNPRNWIKRKDNTKSLWYPIKSGLEKCKETKEKAIQYELIINYKSEDYNSNDDKSFYCGIISRKAKHYSEDSNLHVVFSKIV